ncbi:MAG: phospholipase D family protein [Acidobacteriota bacterium]
MLSPDSRNVLLETLRPPTGYSLDHAVGTTFTLDLLTLLTAPLAFTYFDWQDEEGRPSADPLALLEALRRHASRIQIFCQAGQIQVPPADKPLLGYLEESVFEVRAPRPGGIFHPKVWVLRFVAEGEPVVYRVLNLTRNLTFARSWDTALALEGELADPGEAIAANAPLADLVAALPGMTLRSMSGDANDRIGPMADELRRVRFEPPEGFTDIAFWSQGFEGAPGWPFPQSDRDWLVMAPFVEGRLLERIGEGNRLRCLISRPEALPDVDPETLDRFEERFVLSPYSDIDSHSGVEDRADAPEDAPDNEVISDDEIAELAGLHAKLFVMDDGWNARVWTGSANATGAAFERNVEMLVELRGRNKQCGIDALLGDEEADSRTLRTLLQRYDPLDEGEEEDKDEEQRALERAVERLRDRIVELDLSAHARSDDGESFELTLRRHDTRPLEIPSGASVKVWPVTLPDHRATALETGEQDPFATFESVSVGAITAFFAFDIQARDAGLSARNRFVVRLPLEGAPPDRRERILRDLLSDPGQVVRLLLLLLSEGGMTVSEFVTAARERPGKAVSFHGFDRSTLLESLLRALDRNPGALDDAEHLLRDLGKTEEGAALVPDGLEQIWEPIWECRRRDRAARDRARHADDRTSGSSS